MAGEFDLINWIRERSLAQAKASGLIEVGVGDDLAVLKWPENDLLLVGMDQVIDGVHFDSSAHTLRQIGIKAMNRNLSDCAAMACLPAAALAAVALPKSISLAGAKELYLGMREAADVFECPIVGGDTGSTPGRLTLCVTILGTSAGQRPLTRGGARPGDAIFVTGPLGGSILGRHLNFKPQIELGRRLGRIATSMIDLSDGLSRDIVHICRGSGVGAIIEADAIPIHADAVELCGRDKITALNHALSDGEDYELLFTANEDCEIGARIGRIVAEPGIWLEGGDKLRVALAPSGWEHRLGEQERRSD
ncbi:MAG: thiamine-phosphate kinase [Planctomycetota bacterium]|nr:thiamine-phosphate kinase [Planctomycetota bacterium]